MMYQNRFIASLKVGGKILREQSGTVSLPFGSEYEILLKNLNSRRAMCKVTIDGVDATGKTKLILPANGSLTLERFIKNGNLKDGNRFKFIERTSQIEDHRGIKEDDGLVRVEFWLEKEVIEQSIVRTRYYDRWLSEPRPNRWPYYPRWYYEDNRYSEQATIYCNSLQVGDNNSFLRSAQCSTGNFQGGQQMMAMNCASPANDVGITVAGSKSNQEFQSSWGFETEANSQVVVLQLRGVVGNTPVQKAVTVDSKPTCQTCGKINKISHQFCSNCGTNLHTT